MEQVKSINEYAENLLQVAASITRNYPLSGFAIVVIAENGTKMANSVGGNGYEMAGILQGLSVTSSLGAIQAEQEAAKAAQQQGNIVVPN